MNTRHELLEQQFDKLAPQYDSIKEKNSYYLQTLKEIFAEAVGCGDSTVIEIGCGTGEILNSLKPQTGVGVDISQEMVRVAREKYPQHSFYRQSLEELDIRDTFDYVLLPDVIEYVADLDHAFGKVRQLCAPATTVIITSPNPLWAVILAVAERLKLKMEDRLSTKHSRRRIQASARKQGFELIEYTSRLFFPKNLPGAAAINRLCRHLPLLRFCGLIQVFIYKPKWE